MTYSVDANQAEIVKVLRRAGCEVLSLAMVGNGCPDLIACRAFTLYMLEVKTATGRKTPHQKSFHERWPVAIVTTPEEALKAVGL